MSQTDLSVKSGIPKPTLSRYENDHVLPSISTLQRLAESLGTGEGTLLSSDVSPDEAFLRTLKEHGVTFASVEEAERAAMSAAKVLAPKRAKRAG